MNELCRTYWKSLYWFALSQGLSPGDAEDACQDLFAKLVEQDSVRKVDPAKGSLRSYLVTSLKNMIVFRARHEGRRKRGGDFQMISRDAVGGNAGAELAVAAGETPERIFDRLWVQALLDRAVDLLRRDYEKRKQSEIYHLLVPFLAEHRCGSDFKKIAERLDCPEGTVRVALFRLRKRYRQFVRAEVALTVSDPSLVDREIEELFLMAGK